MPLLKIEHRCTECTKPFILVITPADKDELTCCPFCGSQVDYVSEDTEE